MSRKLVKIEEAEFRYFITIKTLMLNRIGEILNLLNSRRDTSKATLIWEQREYFKFPNSTPIGADLHRHKNCVR